MDFRISQTPIAANGIRLQAISDEEEVGHVYLYILYNDLHKDPFGYLENMFVKPIWRHVGVGTRLLLDAINCAKENSCYKLIMVSRQTSVENHQWYSRHGFTIHGFELRLDIMTFTPHQ